MRIEISQPDGRRMVASLREGAVTTEVTSAQPRQSAIDLLTAFEAVDREGYGECFWPEPTGAYWWMLRKVDQRLEVAVMWSSGGASGWQHVFRAADEIDYLHDLVRTQLTLAQDSP